MSLYLHILVAHVGDFIRRHGNLIKFSGQALEHLHAIMKLEKRTLSTHQNCVNSITQIHLAKTLVEIEKYENWWNEVQTVEWIKAQNAAEDDGVDEE